MRFPNFVGDTQAGQSLTAESARTVNLYVERAADGRSVLLPAPGLLPWSQASADIGARALVSAGDRLFGVVGARLYEWNLAGVPTVRGALALDGNRAQIVYNGQVGGQLGIMSGRNFYAYDLTTNTLTAVLNNEVDQIAYGGGRGFALNLTTGRVRLSNLNNFLVWDAGTFFQRALFADPYRAMAMDSNNLLWMIGSDSFEVRYDTGTTTQPWQPLTGLQGPYGIVGPFAWARLGASLVWVAQNAEGLGSVVMTSSAAPQEIGSIAVNTAIGKYLRTARIDDAEIMPYHQEGHAFAAVSFPSAPATWAYDVSTQSWAERGVWNPRRGDYDLWAPRVQARVGNKLVIGERATARLYVMDAAYATELDGVTGIRRLRRSPHLNAEHKRVPINQFEILMDVGLGLPIGQGSDPQAMLRVSDDHGRTFGNERQAGVGPQGKWGKRVYWTRVGAPADAVFEVTYSEPVPFRVVDAFLNNAEPL